MRNVWLIGSSHILAVRRARRKSELKYEGLQSIMLGAGTLSKTMFHRIEDGRMEFLNDGYQQKSEDFRSSLRMREVDAVGVYLGAAMRTLVTKSNFWKSHEPFAIVEDGKIPVPDSTIRAALEAEARAACAFICDLSTLVNPVFWITCPPIKSHHPMFEEGVRREVIQYLDQLFIEMMKEQLSPRGISVIDRPRAALTEHGLMKPEYSQDYSASGTRDWAHANVEYGSLLLNEIAKSMRLQA